MNKLYDKLLTILFCGFIFIMGILLWALPKQETSVYEKRTLAKMPKLTVSSVLNGKYEGKFEDYINDHFPMRNSFTALDSYYMLYTGRNGMGGIYKGRDGYLINTPIEDREEIYTENTRAILDFVRSTGLPSTMMIIPSTGYIMEDKLPKNHRVYHDGEMLDKIKGAVCDEIRWVEVSGYFKELKDSIQLYYKTDHHYTTAGAFEAYRAFCVERGFLPLEEYEAENYEGFFGTTYSKSALWNEKGDTLEVWRYPSNATVEIDGQLYGSMWFDEHLEELDKYPVFLNGNQPFERIENPDSDGGSLLLVKDSFAHAMVPFLIQHYSRIDMVDLRYYFEPVSRLNEENGYDEVLFVYGTDSICAGNDISILQ
ncbi:MAG: DHHW family protein [Clostridiales bacterium]|nr:DHHW family protein [Clostridiales bacterium]